MNPSLREFMSSSSSVEEVTAGQSSTLKKKTRSRLSLNLGVFDSVTSPSSPVRSPKIISKFLRSSFTKASLRKCLPEKTRIAASLHCYFITHLKGSGKGLLFDNLVYCNEDTFLRPALSCSQKTRTGLMSRWRRLAQSPCPASPQRQTPLAVLKSPRPPLPPPGRELSILQ